MIRRLLVLAALALALTLGSGPAGAQTPTPTPEPTPTPTATPTPDPNRPARVREDDETSLLVSAAHAPDDYHQDRDRGTVRYTTDRRNYSFHRVVLPNARPLTIRDTNFTQALARTVTFWSVMDMGGNLSTAPSNPARVLPNAHNVTAADVGCRVRIKGSGWTRGVYRIASQNGTTWLLDQAPAPVNTTGGDWALVCPMRDFRGITFEDTNLKNVWLPTSVFRPTLVRCQTSQEDLP